ncbi:hypothetical protein [Acinetobacter colistiniresistens]|uniref:hypothetical protein n=1 Tax=Acinetobacter colistiniresistens TaxID=280145 RepID=UPI00208EEA91|nr:hypothetical protein [Acinetobacter colistiniresistens]
MYKLNISTPAFLQASLPISMEVGEFLINRLNQLDSQTIPREELQQKLGYPVGVGSNSGSFLRLYGISCVKLFHKACPKLSISCGIKSISTRIA